MSIYFHPCTVIYQNIPRSYKNGVKLCGFTIIKKEENELGYTILKAFMNHREIIK